MRKKEQVEADMVKLRKELNEIEEKETKENVYPRLEKLVGTFWVYRDNSYGGGSPRKTWDVFKKILDVFYNKDGLLMFITEEFSVDCNGKATLTVESHFPYPYGEERNPFNSGYVETTAEEYEVEKGKMLAEMATHTKAKKRA